MATKAAIPWKAAGEILKALGIDRPATSVTLRIDMKSAMVMIEYPLLDEDMGKIGTLIQEKRYVLHEETKEEPINPVFGINVIG